MKIFYSIWFFNRLQGRRGDRFWSHMLCSGMELLQGKNHQTTIWRRKA